MQKAWLTFFVILYVPVVAFVAGHFSVQSEKRIGADAELVVNSLYAVITRLLFSAQPLPDGGLIHAEYVREFLLTQVVFLHQLFDYVLKFHKEIIIVVRSKVLT